MRKTIKCSLVLIILLSSCYPSSKIKINERLIGNVVSGDGDHWKGIWAVRKWEKTPTDSLPYGLLLLNSPFKTTVDSCFIVALNKNKYFFAVVENNRVRYFVKTSSRLKFIRKAKKWNLPKNLIDGLLKI